MEWQRQISFKQQIALEYGKQETATIGRKLRIDLDQLVVKEAAGFVCYLPHKDKLFFQSAVFADRLK